MMYHGFIHQRKQNVELPEELAAVLGAKRDGKATAENSRGLLVTLLGELVLPHGGTAWTQTLVEAMGLLDVREKASRQVIARMHEEGWIARERVGRRTRWTLSDSSRSLLTEGASRIYGFGAPDSTSWDRRWVVLLVSVPESERHVRYQLNSRLTWAGFGSLGQGTWISPWPAREGEAVRALENLDIDYGTSFVGELGALGTGAELAHRAWDLEAIRDQYDQFLSTADELVVEPVASLRALVMLVHGWRRFPFVDPGLPGQLLPADWPGERAALHFSKLRARLAPEASAWWLRAEARYS